MDNEIEVMRVIRIPPRGQLVVQVGEKRYERITEIQNEAFGRLLLAAVGELVVFANGYDTLVAAGVAPPLSTKSSNKSEPYAESLDERQAAFLESLEQQRDMELMSASPEAAAKMPSPVEELEPVSIVDQINPLILKQVSADPELQGRSVFLENEPSGGVRIKVDGKLYERPEDIEDARVRKAIAAALKEWDAT